MYLDLTRKNAEMAGRDEKSGNYCTRSNGKKERPLCLRPPPSWKSGSPGPLLDDVDVLLRAHLLQDLRPHGHADLAEVRLAQEEHQDARLADAAADRERQRPVHDALVVRELQEVLLVRERELFLKRLGV